MSHILTVLMITWTPPGALALAEACISHWLSNNHFKSSRRSQTKTPNVNQGTDLNFGTESSHLSSR